MMKRIGLIASREFVTTIGNKGFLIGLLVMPAVMALAAVAAPRIMRAPSPQIRGDVAVIDVTARVTGQLRKELDPATIQARRLENARRVVAQAAPRMERAADAGGATQRMVGQAPILRIVERPAGADVDREKNWLITPSAEQQSPDERHLALVVVHPDAVVRADGKSDYGAYDLYVSTTLDDNTEGVIYEALRQSLVNARLEATSLDQAAVEATMRVARPRSVIVAAGGEQQAQRGFTRALPFIMGILLFMGIIIGGQTLMTSTIEEKSSRVVEVLLAAVSPFELMAGKLLGQLGVGLLVMGVYVGLGILALFQFAMLGLLDPLLVLYLIVFFLLSYLVFGALMSAIGAAVNQMADAQSLMGPVMLMLIAPYILTPIIGRAPNSTFSVAVSFIPPVNTFAMMARLASDAPPPAWQVWLTVLVGLAAAAGAVWFAAKIFKIGLLMHGKPPNFATLVRWARAA
jgi:ABC-2 type transport system permease protein